MAEDPRQPVVVAAACDGACSGNPGPGGWGCLLRFDDGSVEELGGAEPSTTNNRMELTACLALLQRLRELPRSPDLSIRTDSRYLIDGFSRWISGWKRKGWRTASGSPVLNRDLWEALDAARLPGLTLEHVRGHNGDPDNERCDAIAVAWSRGQQPTPAPAAPAVAADPAPVPLQRLLSRLELAERLASGGYGLSLVELAQLVEQPLSRLEQRQESWRWRDWQVEPLGEDRWRLRSAPP
jgi:ribonuclease HI